MRLVYCWINNYLGFNDQGFNLGSKYIYSHTFDEKVNKLTLTRIQNKHHIDGYFIKDNDKGFENVTAIVGENGSGKSLIMRLLARIVGNDKLLIAPNFYVLFFENTSGEIEYMIWEEYIDNDSFPISAQPRGQYPIPTQIFFFEKQIRNIRVKENIFSIYYTPILGFEKYSFAANRFTDVSTQAIFKQDENTIKSIYKSQKISQEEPQLALDKINVFEFHKAKETERLLRSLNAFKQREIKTLYNSIILPENVIINWNLENFNRIVLPDIIKSVENGKDNIPFLIQRVEELHLKEDDNLKIHDNLDNNHKRAYNQILFLWFNEILKEAVEVISQDFTFEFMQPSFSFQDAENLEELIINNLNSLTPILNSQEINSQWKNIIIMLKNYIYENNNNVNNGSKNELILNFEKGIELLSHISPIKQSFNFLTFGFRNISSGEQALLNLYSRLYLAMLSLIRMDDYWKNFYSKKHLFLFIDEGELGFHVKWQQSYISILIEAVSIIFQDQHNVSVQLIFATHSPIVLSDIPNYNVVFLEDKVVVEKQDKSKNLPSTFAANIHDILKHSFFMDTSFLGDYVKQSIDEAIFFLKYTIIEKGNPDERGKKLEELVRSNKNLNIDKIRKKSLFIDFSDKKESSNLKTFIDQIDEPILKIKLNEMFYKAIGRSEEEGRLIAQQELISKRLKDLQNPKSHDKN